MNRSSAKVFLKIVLLIIPNNTYCQIHKTGCRDLFSECPFKSMPLDVVEAVDDGRWIVGPVGGRWMVVCMVAGAFRWWRA